MTGSRVARAGMPICRGVGFSDNKPSEVSAAVATIESAGQLLAETKRYIAAAK